MVCHPWNGEVYNDQIILTRGGYVLIRNRSLLIPQPLAPGLLFLILSAGGPLQIAPVGGLGLHSFLLPRTTVGIFSGQVAIVTFNLVVPAVHGTTDVWSQKPNVQCPIPTSSWRKVVPQILAR
jgi:hypothetical protein